MSKSALRIQAEAEAVQLKIDRYVRAIARVGKDVSGDGINFRASVPLQDEHSHLVVRATFGAGTNTAGVHLWRDGLEVEAVYEAHDYGRQLVIFRKGAWVDQLITAGQAAEQTKAVDQVLTQVQRQHAEDERFRPLD